MPPTPPRYQAAIQATQRRLDQVVATGGIAPVRSLFQEVHGQLERDLAKLPGGTFDDARKRSAALQVRAAILRLNQASATIAERGSIDAQVAAVQELATQVQGLERDFRGTVVPVPLLEGARFRGLAANRATSLLTQHRASMARYGAETIREVEGVMARSLIGNESTTDTIDKIAETVGGSRWRAERIHRTEQAWSYNAGHVDGLVTQATTLPDLMMRWSEHVSDAGAALDDRVAVDSLAMHGQLAPPGGLFTQPPAAPDGEQVPDGLVLQTWAHPPNRPNDRAVISPWRPHWGVPGWIWQDGGRQPYTGGGRVPEISTKAAPAPTGGAGLPAPVATAEIREEAGAPPPMRSGGVPVAVDTARRREVDNWMRARGRLLAATLPSGPPTAQIAAEVQRRRPLSDVLFASVSNDPSLGAVARGGLERVLRESGIATPTESTDRNRAAATIRVARDLDTGGVHAWDGSILVGRRTADQVAAMADKLSRGAGATVTGGEVGSLNVLIHEQLHGATPIGKDGYEGIGAMIEEVSTEALARRATRQLATTAGVPGHEVAAAGVGAPRHENDGAYARELLQVRRAIQDATGLSDAEAYDLLERASRRLKSRAADPAQRGLSAAGAADAFAADLAAEHGGAVAAGKFRAAIAKAPTMSVAAAPRSVDDVARFEARYGPQRVEQRLAKLQEDQFQLEMGRFPTLMFQFEKEAEARIAAASGVESWQLTSRELEQVKSEVAAERARREAIAAKAAAAEIDKDRKTFARVDRMVREGKIRVPPSAKLDAAQSAKTQTVSVLDEERQAIDREQRTASRTLATARSASESSSWFEDVSVVPTDEDIASVGLVKRGDTWIDPHDDDAVLTEEEARNYWSDSEEGDDEEASKLQEEIETLRDTLSDTDAPEEWDTSISTLEEFVSAEESKVYGEEDPDEEVDADHPEEMTPAQYRAALAATRDQMRRQAERAQAALERVHAAQTRSRDRIKATIKDLNKASTAAVREVEKVDTDDLVVGDDEEGEAYAAAEFLLSTEVDDRNETTGVRGRDGSSTEDLDGVLKDAAAATARRAKELAKVTGRPAVIEKPVKKPKATKAKAKAKPKDEDDEEDDDEQPDE